MPKYNQRRGLDNTQMDTHRSPRQLQNLPELIKSPANDHVAPLLVKEKREQIRNLLAIVISESAKLRPEDCSKDMNEFNDGVSISNIIAALLEYLGGNTVLEIENSPQVSLETLLRKKLSANQVINFFGSPSIDLQNEREIENLIDAIIAAMHECNSNLLRWADLRGAPCNFLDNQKITRFIANILPEKNPQQETWLAVCMIQRITAFHLSRATQIDTTSKIVEISTFAYEYKNNIVTRNLTTLTEAQQEYNDHRKKFKEKRLELLKKFLLFFITCGPFLIDLANDFEDIREMYVLMGGDCMIASLGLNKRFSQFKVPTAVKKYLTKLQAILALYNQFFNDKSLDVINKQHIKAEIIALVDELKADPNLLKLINEPVGISS